MTLGNLLGTYGVPTLVLERNAGLEPLPRAVGVDRDCLRAWQAAGLDEALLRDMSPMGADGLGMVYLDSTGRPFMQVRPERCEYGFAFGYGFIQPIADRILLDGLQRFETLEVRFAHQVEAISQDADRVALCVRDANGAKSSIRAQYVVACDGGHSTVRQSLGIAMQGSTYHERWLVVDTLEPTDAVVSRDVEIHCDPARPTVSVPRRYGHRRFELRLRDDEVNAEFLRDDRIRALLAPHTDSSRIQILRKLVYRFNARLAARFRTGSVFLAGDAAHVTPPFAAQGLAMGIRDAFNLAWKLARVIQGGAAAELLDSYEDERRPEARATIRLALWLGRVMMPRSHWRGAVVPAAIRLLNRSPAFARSLREGGPKPEPRVRGDLLVRDGRRGSVAGRWLHQPWVVDASGRHDKLDRFLGNGFALLGWSIDPLTILDERIAKTLDQIGTRVWTLRETGTRHIGERDLCDTEGAFAAWLGAPGDRLLFVRPDRFVAADLRAADAAERLAPLIQRLGGKTS